MARLDPGIAGDQVPGDRRDGRPAPHGSRPISSAECMCDPTSGRDRAGKNAACACDPTAGIMFQGVKMRVTSALDTYAFPGFKNSRSEPESLKGATPGMPREFEHADSGA